MQPFKLIQESPDAALAELRRLRDEAQSLYRREAASMLYYVRTFGDRTVVAKRTDAVASGPTDPTDQATCTCFVASHFAAFAPAAGARLGGPAASFVGLQTSDVLQTIIADFKRLYEVTPDGLASRQAPEAKESGGLPNTYSTSLHLCGLTAALGHLADARLANADVVGAGWAAADLIGEWLLAGSGFVTGLDARSDDGSAAPHAYLSYWCVRSIVGWLDLDDQRDVPDAVRIADGARATQVRNALEVCLDAHLDYLSRILVAYHAGIGSTFDADDIVCMIASVALTSRRLGRRDEFVDAVLPHAIDVLLAGYVHGDGSFVPNAPVLEPPGLPVITASTEELNAILLHAVEQELTATQAVGLRHALAHAQRKSGGPRGWGGAPGAGVEGRTAFVSSAALSFLLGYHAVLDRLIARLCAAGLGVRLPDSNIERFKLPPSVAALVESNILPMVTKTGRRNLAVTSLVLGGPRSASKEKIACKIAYTLDWPILTFDPVSFLGDENSGLDLEIRRNLDLLSELSDTVVFFDALDDWLRAPPHSAARRLLSWSMLGRLDQLTSPGRILLVTACEDPARLGLSQDRAGRLDTVIMLEPPTEEERVALLTQLYDVLGADAEVRGTFEQSGVVSRSAGFTEGHLRELVRACVARQVHAGMINGDMVRDTIDSIRQRMANGGN